MADPDGPASNMVGLTSDHQGPSAGPQETRSDPERSSSPSGGAVFSSREPESKPKRLVDNPFVGITAPPSPDAWDELRANDGSLRPAWARFADLLPSLPPGQDLAAELDRRRHQVDERILRDGVTHNVFGPEGAATRPWSVELLPFLIAPEDWARIEAGLTQRARLLQAILADLYGPRRLLAEGLLPPALVFRHPGYVRPLHGVRPAGGHHLLIIAFDIARGPEGGWWLVAQRTQVPSGLGYVLHNRLLVMAQFPEAFRDLRVQHIASGYRRLLDAIEGPARELAGGQPPRLALLTAGPYGETWYEQAYLARYLGLTLVEGSDLQVRDDRLWLKTVEGLEPVQGLLRRVDDDWCDPLELRPDSALGVPGLVQVVRAGQVVMANALGSAVLESPAILGFLPAIARRLLDQELLLPALPTWWCGEPAAWDAVKDRLDDKRARGTFPQGGRTSPVFAADPARIGLDPDAWTIQSRLRLSRTPLWQGRGLRLRPALVRVYAIADGQGGWQLLPGGMTRVARREEASVSMQRGGTSLDTWVLTEGPVDAFSLLPGKLSVDEVRGRRRPLSSRTGENLFWLGRYTERTEQQVSLARATLLFIADDGAASGPLLEALSTLGVRAGLVGAGVGVGVGVRAAAGDGSVAGGGVRAAAGDGALAGAGTGVRVAGGEAGPGVSPRDYERALLRGLAASGAEVGLIPGIPFNLQALERVSLALRDRLSTEHWSLMQRMRVIFARSLSPAEEGLPVMAKVLPALDRLAVQLAAATGAQSDRMTRDLGWRLLILGRLLERLVGLTQSLEVFLATGALASTAGVSHLLELFDSTITFRARYQGHEDLLALADLLVLDDTNPRAFAGVLRRLRTELSKLPGAGGATGSTTASATVTATATPSAFNSKGEAGPASLVARLPAVGVGISLEDLRDVDDETLAVILGDLARDLRQRALSLAEEIGHRYFALADGPSQVQHT